MDYAHSPHRARSQSCSDAILFATRIFNFHRAHIQVSATAYLSSMVQQAYNQAAINLQLPSVLKAVLELQPTYHEPYHEPEPEVRITDIAQEPKPESRLAEITEEPERTPPPTTSASKPRYEPASKQEGGGRPYGRRRPRGNQHRGKNHENHDHRSRGYSSSPRPQYTSHSHSSPSPNDNIAAPPSTNPHPWMPPRTGSSTCSNVSHVPGLNPLDNMMATRELPDRSPPQVEEHCSSRASINTTAKPSRFKGCAQKTGDQIASAKARGDTMARGDSGHQNTKRFPQPPRSPRFIPPGAEVIDLTSDAETLDIKLEERTPDPLVEDAIGEQTTVVSLQPDGKLEAHNVSTEDDHSPRCPSTVGNPSTATPPSRNQTPSLTTHRKRPRSPSPSPAPRKRTAKRKPLPGTYISPTAVSAYEKHWGEDYHYNGYWGEPMWNTWEDRHVPANNREGRRRQVEDQDRLGETVAAGWPPIDPEWSMRGLW